MEKITCAGGEVRDSLLSCLRFIQPRLIVDELRAERRNKQLSLLVAQHLIAMTGWNTLLMSFVMALT